MTSGFTVYDSSGMILRSGICQEDMVSYQAQSPEESVIPFMSDGSSQYVVDGDIAERPDSPVTVDKITFLGDGLDAVTLSNVPVGSVVSIGSQVHTVDDGAVEFATYLPGSYAIKVDAFPYLPFEQVVTAV